MNWSQIVDMPNGDWPYLLLGLCGAILGFLVLWFAVKVACSACSSAPGRTDKPSLPQGPFSANTLPPSSGS